VDRPARRRCAGRLPALAAALLALSVVAASDTSGQVVPRPVRPPPLEVRPELERLPLPEFEPQPSPVLPPPPELPPPERPSTGVAVFVRDIRGCFAPARHTEPALFSADILAIVVSIVKTGKFA
jgi:hypothetical protein